VGGSGVLGAPRPERWLLKAMRTEPILGSGQGAKEALSRWNGDVSRWAKGASRALFGVGILINMNAALDEEQRAAAASGRSGWEVGVRAVGRGFANVAGGIAGGFGGGIAGTFIAGPGGTLPGAFGGAYLVGGIFDSAFTWIFGK